MAEAADGGQPEHARPGPLVAWALGAFHAALLVAVLVGLGHAADALGELGDLNTAVGLALYLLLWVLSWGVSRRVLAEVPPARVAEPGGIRRALAWGVLGGAATGAGFLVAIVVVFVAPALLLRGGEPLSVVLIALVGLPVAAVVGAVVGALFALLDVALIRGAGRLAAPGPRRP